MRNDRDYVSLEKKFVFGTWRYENTWNPIMIEEADGCYFIDVEGKRYLDFSSQLMCSNLGHKKKLSKLSLSRRINFAMSRPASRQNQQQNSERNSLK